MSGNRAPAVVLAGDINGLGVVRSLDEAGIPTIVVTMSPVDPVLASRLPWRKLLVPPARPLGQALLETLSWVSEGCVLIPTSNEHVAFMVANRAALARQFDLCLPSSTVLSRMLDRQHQAQLVEGLGLPLAGQVIPGQDDQLWVCNCTFDAHHALVGAFTFRLLGLAQAHSGVTSYAISQRNPVLVDLMSRLGRAIGYVGPLTVELKLDGGDHQYKLVELNPRLGMCNAFDTACGVNNVLASYQLAVGQPPTPPSGPQRDGVVFLSFVDDLHSRRSQGQSLPSALRTYARNAGRQHVSAHFRWHDPGPAAAVALEAARRMIRRLGRKTAPPPAAEDHQREANLHSLQASAAGECGGEAGDPPRISAEISGDRHRPILSLLGRGRLQRASDPDEARTSAAPHP